MLIRIHTTACKRGKLAVPSTEALKLAFLLAAYPGGEHAAIARCREQLEQRMLAHEPGRASQREPLQQHPVAADHHEHQDDADADGAEADAQQQQTILPDGAGLVYRRNSQQQEPLIAMIKSWAHHGGAAGASSTVVHVLASTSGSTLYVQPGGSAMLDAQAFFQEAAAATHEGLAAGPPSCLTPKGVLAGVVEQSGFCGSPVELLESIANRMQSEIVPALYQRPLKGRTVLVTVDRQEENKAMGESFLAVELVAVAEARKQKESISK